MISCFQTNTIQWKHYLIYYINNINIHEHVIFVISLQIYNQLATSVNNIREHVILCSVCKFTIS